MNAAERSQWRTPSGQGLVRRRPSAGSSAAPYLALLVSLVILSGCRTSGLLFFKSSDLRITNPRSSSTVSLPFTISWVAHSAKPGDRFAVFLDRGTISPGENLSSLVPDSCKKVANCSLESYLQQQDVWVTSGSSLILTTLPTKSLTGASSGREDHSVTVVVVNRAGVRVGEDFGQVDFVYVRRAV
jgi:hypothetical protein